MSKRELRSGGSTTVRTLDKSKEYKLNTSGALVESTGTPGGTEIVFSGSKSSLRRLSDLERNVSILAAKALSDDGEGSGYSSSVDYSRTAGKWVQARTLSLTGDVTGSATIDGSGNVSLSTTVANNTVALGTDTTGNYMVNVTAGTGISVSHTQGEGSTATISSTITQYTDALAVSANASAIAAAKSEAISAAISTVTNGAGAAFDTLKEIQDAMSTDTELSAAIAAISNVPSATKLQTARTINGVSFDGTGNISFSTSAVSEGTNLYYTDARARLAMSPGTGMSYNSFTGTFNNSGVLSINTGGGITTTAINGNITLGSNATSANTAGAIVARGASGEIAVGALTVSGAITATGEVTAYYSDLRLKTNIVQIPDALEKVEALNGVTFDPNEAALALGIDNRHQMGVIAQEVEAVAPELVCDSAFAGYKTVRYDKLTALLIEAVKELSAKVKTLEAKLGDTKPQL